MWRLLWQPPFARTVEIVKLNSVYYAEFILQIYDISFTLFAKGEKCDAHTQWDANIIFVRNLVTRLHAILLIRKLGFHFHKKTVILLVGLLKIQ